MDLASPEAQRKNLEAKRNNLARQKTRYENLIRALNETAEPLGPPEPPDGELEQPPEQVFTNPVGIASPDEAKALKVDRAKLPHPKGYHVAFENTSRLDLKLVVTKIDYKVETLTDIKTGKSYRAPTHNEGPSGFNVTWRFVETIVKLAVGFAIPLNRIELMVGQKGFESGKLCRILAYIAHKLLPVYLVLAERLADVKIISGDDTKGVIVNSATPETPEGEEPSGIVKMLMTLDDRLGFKALRKDGKGDIKALNTSLVMGREYEKDKRSTICFFWTHFGYVGNLLTKIFEQRSPRLDTIIFQGDLSANNLPDKTLRTLFNLVLAGCGSHARRPFWRHRDDDPDLCYFMLRGFALLSKIEKTIDRRGRTHKRTLALRRRYAKKIWQALYNRCFLAATGERLTAATKPYTKPPHIRWPKKAKLRTAAEYVLGHFDTLTRYIEDPRLEFTNHVYAYCTPIVVKYPCSPFEHVWQARDVRLAA